MTGFIAEIDNNAAAAAEEAAAGGGNGFPPLPAGKYQATVLKVDGVADFGGQGGNAKKKVVKIQLQIVADSPNGAKRMYFARIPLFTRFAPKDGAKEGKTARAFWDFWGKAIGTPDNELILGRLPGVPETQGKRITITLGAPIAPDKYNPLGSNEVGFFDKAGDLSATPLGKAAVAWLDADGNLIGGAPAAAPRAQAAAPAGPPAWGGAAAAPAGPPAWAGAPAEAVKPAGDPEADAPWSPAAEDVAFASTQAGKGF